MRLTVATYNIHKGVANQLFGVRRAATIHELRGRLHELGGDLIFLQEVLGQNDRHARRFDQWPSERQDQFLARAPQLAHVLECAYGRNASYLHGHHGNALLSRFPIVRTDNRDVSDHALEKRGVLHCEIDLGGVRLHCFVVHFGLFARSRERQADVLIEWIDRAVAPHEPLLVAGDFNDWRDALSERFYRRLGMQEVFDVARPPMLRKAANFVRARLPADAPRVSIHAGRPRGAGEAPGAPGAWPGGLPAGGQAAPASRVLPFPGLPGVRLPLGSGIRPARTFPSLLPWLRMDRIYQRGFRVLDAKVLRGPAWAKLSDHAPLVATLELPPATLARIRALRETQADDPVSAPGAVVASRRESQR